MLLNLHQLTLVVVAHFCPICYYRTIVYMFPCASVHLRSPDPPLLIIYHEINLPDSEEIGRNMELNNTMSRNMKK